MVASNNKKIVKIEKKPKKNSTSKKKLNVSEVAGIKKVSKTTKTSNKIKNRSKKWSTKNIILISLLSLGILVIGVIIIFALYIIFTAPDFDKSLLYDKEMTVLKDRNGDVFARLGAENRDIVYYEELPQVLVDAIVAVEDSRYFQHNGFDIARFAKASLGQLAGNSGAGGASTLTMQVAKNTYTSSESRGIEGIVRKFTDIYFSIFKIEKAYTKQEIIEFYVNAPWLGNGCWGVEAASQKYFGKSVRDLSLSEAALMAGIFNLPASYNPFASVELATQRRSVVLDLMVRHGYITDSQRDYAESISVESLIVPESERTSGLHKYQSFIDVLANEVEAKTNNNPYVVPMEIETTLDPAVQDVLFDLNNENLNYEFINDIIQVAVAVTDVNDGSIVGINGGRGQKIERDFNRATQMKRHPGSTAKPIFDYAPFFEYNNGSTYSLFFDDETTYSDGTSIKNSDGTYLGLITAREALKRSRNIPALQAFQQVDKNDIADFVHSLGIDYGDYLFESMAIGGFDGTSPLDISAAYAAFASGGYYTEPYSFTKITYIDSGDVYEQKPKRVKVMSEETAFMINSILMSTASYGVAGNVYVKGTDIAAKSGTSTYDYSAIKSVGIPSKVAGSLSRDNWVNVYSPDYSIAVWYGYDYLMKDYYTTAIKGDAERKKITAVISNKIFKTGSRFSVPDGVVKVEVEKETFPPQLPSEFTPETMRVEEYFKKGTEPTEVSQRYATLSDPSNGDYTADGNSITISWDAISTPNAIDINSLQSHFNTYYSKWAEKYYEKRLEYNSKNIGTIGYQVYLQTDTGLKKIDFTESTSYTYTCPTDTCTFVVKSAYSIFKDNISPGLTIEAQVNTINEEDNENNDISTDEELNNESENGVGNVAPIPSNVSISYNGGKKVCYKSGIGTYTDSNPLFVYDNGYDVTGESMINIKYYLNGLEVNSIKLDKPGSYLAKYYIDYDGSTYNGSKTINICSNGCNSNNECK